jgi:cell division protein FtsN
MSRLDFFTIGIIAVCILAIIFLLYRTTDIFKSDDPAPTDNTESLYEDDLYRDDVVDPSDYSDEDEEDSAAASDEETAVPDESMTYDEKVPASDPTDEEYEKDDDGKAEDVTSNYSSGVGEFMVIAGSFKIKANAEAYARQLRGKGYNDARTELFDRGAYAVVLVDRFDDLGSAKDLVSELKSKNVEATVYRKRGSK